MSGRLPRIWIITDPKHPDGPVAPIRRALADCPPGLVGVQLRAKGISDRQVVAWGRELRSLTRATGCVLTLNRRVDLAEVVAADGVHLPERSLPIGDLRRHWPQLAMIGVSRHDRQGLEEAERDGATYAFLSPIFDVPGKAWPIGIEGFATAIADVGIPTYALGGIEPKRLRALLAAGGAGVAICRAIYGASQPERALQQFVGALDNDLRKGG